MDCDVGQESYETDHLPRRPYLMDRNRGMAGPSNISPLAFPHYPLFIKFSLRFPPLPPRFFLSTFSTLGFGSASVAVCRSRACILPFLDRRTFIPSSILRPHVSRHTFRSRCKPVTSLPFHEHFLHYHRIGPYHCFFTHTYLNLTMYSISTTT